MLKRFEHHIAHNFSFLHKGRSLLAISGGVDSVVLTYLCKEIGLDFALAHCNFKLRGAASDLDEAFVLELANELDLEVFIQNFNTEEYAKLNKISTQMAARELRYEWFDDLCRQMKFDYLLTAHHADDNLETFLINSTRGSGLEGLTGIPQMSGNIVRPLLPFSRKDVEEFAKESKISWREDASNESVKYLRNKLRHQVVPILKEINPQLLDSFKDTISYLKEAEDIIKDKLDEVADSVFDVTTEGVKIDIVKIKALSNPKAYLYFLLKDYGFTEWNDVVHLLDAQSGTQVFSKEWRLLKDRDHLILKEREDKNDQVITINENESVVEFPKGKLEIREINVTDHLTIDPNIIYVDKDKLKFPLTLRNWQQGDLFYPLGMKGKKKVSKYFKDEKFSLIEKENAWLLCSGKEIVWIVNHRADNRFKVSERTSKVLQIVCR